MLSYLAGVIIPHLPLSWVFTIAWYLLMLSCTACIYWYGFGRFRSIKSLGIPGPKPMPFIAHLPDLIKTNFEVHLFLDSYIKEYGDCFGIYMQGIPSLIVSDPEVLKQVFVKEASKFETREIFAELPEPLKSIITVVKGNRWKFIRNTLLPYFTVGKLRPLAVMMNKVTNDLLSQCRKAAQSKQPIDIVRAQKILTMEVILSSAFGTEPPSENEQEYALEEKVKQAMSQPKWINIIALVPGSFKFVKYIPYGLAYMFDPMLQFAKEIVRQRQTIKMEKEKEDYLQLLLNAQQKPHSETCCFTTDEVLAQSLVFLLAGSENSSTTLALTCYHLAIHQDVQERLYQEIKEHFPQEYQTPDFDSAQELEYLEMVICETLRLYPPGYFLFRTCQQDCIINGIPIKKGFNVVAPTYSIHRDARFWSDPENFNPERFRRDKLEKMDKFTYMPFGHGPRSCIGVRFAQMEMKIVLIRLIKDFRLDICQETSIPPNVSVGTTLSVRDPIRIKVIAR